MTKNIETSWVNLYVHPSIAEYINIAGLEGNGYYNGEEPMYCRDPKWREDRNKALSGFRGMASISVDEYRCCNEDCNNVKHQLRIEGLINGVEDTSLQYCEAHLYAKSSLNTHSEWDGNEFLILSSWGKSLVGIISGKSIVTRHTPPPPGYPNHIRSGNTLNTWAKPGPELICNVHDEYECPHCVRRKRAQENLSISEEELWKRIKEKAILVKLDEDDPMSENPEQE